MRKIVAFLKPTRIKLLFLVEWVLFILVTAARGELETGHQLLVAGYPLAFFYLVACAVATASQQRSQVASGWKLLVIAVGLIVLDQVIKAFVVAFVPYEASLPIINNWLHLAHERNIYGSWIASTFDLQSVIMSGVVQWIFAILVLVFTILCYRYYITNNRQSVWVDVTFLGLVAGYASWTIDMAFRGYIVDFINLPGLVTADLKDIAITLGVAALFAEALDNPTLSWRWAGWQQERDDWMQLVRKLCSFCIQDMRAAGQALTDRFRRFTRLE